MACLASPACLWTMSVLPYMYIPLPTPAPPTLPPGTSSSRLSTTAGQTGPYGSEQVTGLYRDQGGGVWLPELAIREVCYQNWLLGRFATRTD